VVSDDAATDLIDGFVAGLDHRRDARGNFQTFLTLLTTQLQNQNPLSPLDTNQFTQQLVQFAGVEQQLKTNEELTSLITLQQTAQSTQALGFVGKTVVVDGNTANLTTLSATWDVSVPNAASLNLTITNSTGQTVFSNTYSVEAGDKSAICLERQGHRWHPVAGR